MLSDNDDKFPNNDDKENVHDMTIVNDYKEAPMGVQSDKMMMEDENEEVFKILEQIAWKDKNNGEKMHSESFNFLRIRIDIHYLLWSLIVLLEIMIVLVCTSGSSIPGYNSTIALCFLLQSILVRQDLFLNAIYIIVTILKNVNGEIGSRGSKIKYHLLRMINCIGGFHTFSAFTGFIWLIVYWNNEEQNSSASVEATIWIPFCLLFVVIVLASPWVRSNNMFIRSHDFFQFSHRYLGWICIIIFQIHLLIIVSFDGSVINQANFYIIIIFFAILMAPWTQLRRKQGTCLFQSDKFVIFEFDETQKIFGKAQAGRAVKISELNNCQEFHSFAVIPSEKNKFKIFISAVGDWTKKATQVKINDKLWFWVRGWKVSGFMSLAMSYKKVIFVCSGGGLAPCLPYILDDTILEDIFVIWSKPANAHLPIISEEMEILKKQRKAIILNTVKGQRPSIAEATVNTLAVLKNYNFEAIFVVSGPDLTNFVIDKCRKIGFPTFGAVFDS